MVPPSRTLALAATAWPAAKIEIIRINQRMDIRALMRGELDH
jgi:hypothetical protein